MDWTSEGTLTGQPDTDEVLAVAKSTDWDSVFHDVSRPAFSLLALISFGTCNSVPQDFFLSQREGYRKIPYDEEQTFLQAVQELVDRKLLARVENEHGLHLQLAVALQIGVSVYTHFGSTLGMDIQCRVLYDTYRILARKNFPRLDIAERGDGRYWTEMQKYYNCVEGLLVGAEIHKTNCDDFTADDLEFAELLTDAARYQYEIGYGVLGMPLLKKASVICANAFSIHDKRVMSLALHTPVLCLASAYEAFAGLEARDRAERSITKSMRAHDMFKEVRDQYGLESQTRLTEAMLLSRIGETFMQKERLDLASTHHARSLAIYQKEGGEEQHGFRCGRIHLHNAFIKASEGTESARAALEMSIWAFQLIEPRTTTCLHSRVWFEFLRALLLFNCGDVNGSLDLHRRVLEDRKQYLGFDDHETLSSQYCVAVCEMQEPGAPNLLESEQKLRYLMEKQDTSPIQARWRDEDRARARFRLFLNLHQQLTEGHGAFVNRTQQQRVRDGEQGLPSQSDENVGWDPLLRKTYGNKAQEAIDHRQEALEMRSKWDHLIPAHVVKYEWWDADRMEMARFDYCVHLWHGRTAGIWNPQQYW